MSPCEKFKRMRFTPESRSFESTSCEILAGPSVAIILVRLSGLCSYPLSPSFGLPIFAERVKSCGMGSKVLNGPHNL